MNQRNVDALRDMLEPFMRLPAKPSAEIMACVLAGQGVLVPSALTDKEAGGLAWFAYGAIEDSEEPGFQDVRAELERIAKGET